MLDGLIVIDQQGRKYRIVLIKDAAPLTSSSNGSNTLSTLSFGVWLKQERLRLKLTQKQLAQASGIQQPNIVSIEKGRRVPEIETKDALIAGLKKLA